MGSKDCGEKRNSLIALVRVHFRCGSCVTSNAGPNGDAYTRDEGGPFEFGNQVLISNHRKPLSSKAPEVSVAEKPEQDSGRHD